MSVITLSSKASRSADFALDMAVLALRALAAEMFQVRRGRQALRHGEVRHQEAGIFQLQVALLDDAHRVRHGVGDLGEAFEHLVAALHVNLVGLAREAVRVVDRRARLDAEQDVVRRVILAPDEMDIVGGDERQPGARALRDEELRLLPLLGHAVVHHFEEEMVAPEPLRHVVD